MNTIRVGVIGVGHLGKYHLQKYSILPNNEIIGAVDLIEERARQAAELYGCRPLSDYRQLIGNVDAVSITTPTESHYRIAKDFLEAGIDVMLEKPITAALEEANELVSIAENNNLILQIGFVERFNPAITALKTVMGKPLFIEAHRLHPFYERGTDVDVILDLMIHDLDIIMHFVRSPIVDIKAVGVSVLSDKVDIANARLSFESGCIANITASRITSKTMQKIRFFGFEGYHSVDYSKRELLSLSKRKGADGRMEIIANPVEVKKLDPLEEEIRSFLDSVTTRKPASVPGKDGRDALDVAIRISQKIREAQEMLYDANGRPKEEV